MSADQYSPTTYKSFSVFFLRSSSHSGKKSDRICFIASNLSPSTFVVSKYHFPQFLNFLPFFLNFPHCIPMLFLFGLNPLLSLLISLLLVLNQLLFYLIYLLLNVLQFHNHLFLVYLYLLIY